MKSITGSLFTENLYYNESYRGKAVYYNGNISAVNWEYLGSIDKLVGKDRAYAFSYDNLSRLTTADYYESAGVASTNYKTAYSFDKHGNMKTLQRYGKTSSGATYALVDNLTMTYSGNQLVHAADAVTNPAYSESADFKDKVSATGTIEYTYTANGAMNKDLNKGISDIQYNSLNLPQVMIINSPTAKAKNYYTYSASGVKLKTEQRYDPNYTVTPSNATNPTNDGLADYMNRDYAGNIIYETAKNGSAITNRTRILVDGGYYEGGVYYYYLTDHLGNNRVVVNQSGTVTQKNHYYPFGTAFADKYDNGTSQPYKYNGKELDGMHQLNLYDYSARYYESALGRFTSVDPLAEKYYSWSPYAYCGNNPIKFIDKDGRSYGFPPIGVDPAAYRQMAASKYVEDQIKTNSSTIQKNAAVGLLAMSDVNDAVVLGTTITRGSSGAVNVDGTPAGGIGVGFAALGAVLPAVSGSAVKGFFKSIGKALGIGGDAAKTSKVVDGANSIYESSRSVRSSSGYRSKSSSVSNVDTNVNKAEFGQNLEKSGYNASPSKDGKVTNYTKGDKKYTVRDDAKSTGGSTADYSQNGELKRKIRLGQE